MDVSSKYDFQCGVKSPPYILTDNSSSVVRAAHRHGSNGNRHSESAVIGESMTLSRSAVRIRPVVLLFIGIVTFIMVIQVNVQGRRRCEASPAAFRKHGETGRRAALKMPWFPNREGSTPSASTILFLSVKRAFWRSCLGMAGLTGWGWLPPEPDSFTVYFLII